MKINKRTLIMYGRLDCLLEAESVQYFRGKEEVMYEHISVAESLLKRMNPRTQSDVIKVLDHAILLEKREEIKRNLLGI